MAIIICNECGKEISDSAKTCPHCGCETDFGKKEKKVKENSIIVLLAFGAICIGLILFLPAFVTIVTNMNDWYFWNWYTAQSNEAIRNLSLGAGFLAGGGAYIGVLIKKENINLKKMQTILVNFFLKRNRLKRNKRSRI